MTATSRTYNSVKNVSYGLVLAGINAIIGFVNRTFFVKYLGPEYLGLNGLFTEVIAVLSLAELGVGMAINYSLYRPIHENDTQRINQLMALFRKSYNIISAVILVAGLLVLPFVHLIVKETPYSIPYIRLVFSLFVVNTAVSYLFSYNASFIGASQKQYVVSFVQTVSKFAFTVCSILLLIMTRNYILYLILMILQTFLSNVVLSFYVRRHYPYISYHASLPQEEKQSVFRDIKNIFIKKISGVVTSSTDNILISALVSTVQVGFYSNYVMIFSLLRMLKFYFANGVKASIGDLTVAASAEDSILVLNRLTFLFFFFAITSCSFLLACCSDVITLWLGVDYVMAKVIVIVAIVNLYIEILSEPLWQYLEVSGLFKEDRNIAILGSVINLVVSFVLGARIGIVGIFLGTLCTQVIQFVLKTRLLFSVKYSQPAKGYLLKVGHCLLLFALVLVVCFLYERFVLIKSLWLSLFIKGFVFLGIGVIITIVPYFKSEELSYSVQLFKRIVSRSR